jgi:hypothetical protein
VRQGSGAGNPEGSRLKRRGKSSVIASVTLVDGREQTIDERVKRC